MSTSCESTSLKKSSGDCLKLAKHVIQHLSEMMLFLNYCIFSGNAEALVTVKSGIQYAHLYNTHPKLSQENRGKTLV